MDGIHFTLWHNHTLHPRREELHGRCALQTTWSPPVHHCSDHEFHLVTQNMVTLQTGGCPVNRYKERVRNRSVHWETNKCHNRDDEHPASQWFLAHKWLTSHPKCTRPPWNTVPNHPTTNLDMSEHRSPMKASAHCFSGQTCKKTLTWHTSQHAWSASETSSQHQSQ